MALFGQTDQAMPSIGQDCAHTMLSSAGDVLVLSAWQLSLTEQRTPLAMKFFGMMNGQGRQLTKLASSLSLCCRSSAAQPPKG